MRLSVAVTGLVTLGILCLAGGRQQDSCAVTLRLVDAAGGQELPGLVSFQGADGKPVEVAELLSRGLGLKGKLGVESDAPIHRWWVLTKQTTIRLPRTPVRIEAFSSLETEAAEIDVDLTGKTTATVTIPLTRFDDPRARGYRSANTHLHVMKISRAQCDRYLREVPKGDGLDALFLSYLERAVADREYISNRYTDGDLASLEKASGTKMGNGEEHRHNIGGGGEGYGHVMLLNIKELIQPVSIGQGIMKMGTDGVPLQRGIDTAHRDGATVVWCHNAWGMEALPNFLTGRVDAQNIFDGGSRNSYKESFYKYLNAGLNVPFSTGTDWFVYDFSRAYAQMDGDVTIEKWLEALRAGKTFITNGPLLEFSVAGKSVGETVSLATAGPVAVNARARGRIDFERLELVRNGKVIRLVPSKPVGRHFEAEFSADIPLEGPCWLAIRTPPPPVADDPLLLEPVPKNELGKDLFAHSSAVAIQIDGRRYFDEAVARELLTTMKKNRDFVAANLNFTDDQERARVLDVHRDGISALEKRIAEHRNAGR
jgi:hypothetical protein